MLKSSLIVLQLSRRIAHTRRTFHNAAHVSLPKVLYYTFQLIFRWYLFSNLELERAIPVSFALGTVVGSLVFCRWAIGLCGGLFENSVCACRGRRRRRVKEGYDILGLALRAGRKG